MAVLPEITVHLLARRVLAQLLWTPQTATVGASHPSPACASAFQAAHACQRWGAQSRAAQAPPAHPQSAMPEGSLLLPRGCAAAPACQKTGTSWLALQSCSRGRLCTSRCAARFNVVFVARLDSLMVSRRVCRGHHCIVRCATQCNTLLADSSGRHMLPQGCRGRCCIYRSVSQSGMLPAGWLLLTRG